MSFQTEPLHHPVNGAQEEVWGGWSWPAFFFGFFWMLVKGLWGHALLTILITIVTGGIAAPFIWVIYGAIGNKCHSKKLLKQGYLTKTQWEERKRPPVMAVSASPAPSRDLAAQLRELADLHRQGVLTDEEFATQKTKLLAT